MLEDKVRDVNVAEIKVLPTPNELVDEIPSEGEIGDRVYDSRIQIKRILDGSDERLMVIVGPCSIHDVKEGMEYARLLKSLADKVGDKIKIVMRTYLEKPRSTVGWTGLAYDPDLDDTGDIEKGLRLSRGLLHDIVELGLPTATEFVNLDIPQYYSDLISYVAIGARTYESQPHRHLASGLSMPVGIKNGTCGDAKKAVDAVVAARATHTFLGINMGGRSARIATRGNQYAHVILRGGKTGPNYDEKSVNEVLEMQNKSGVDIGIVIDASHDNSGKDPYKQPDIVYDVVKQRISGNKKIVGVMIESNLKKDSSITDPCLPWKETEEMIMKVYEML